MFFKLIKSIKLSNLSIFYTIVPEKLKLEVIKLIIIIKKQKTKIIRNSMKYFLKFLSKLDIFYLKCEKYIFHNKCIHCILYNYYAYKFIILFPSYIIM